MGLKIVWYEASHEAAVAAFNQRLKAAEVPFQFFERAASSWLPPEEGSPVYRTYRLAIDDQGFVRGGYGLRVQDFSINGETHVVANYQLPLSEGIFDPTYLTLGTRLLRSALREFPLLYSLGMGGIDKPLPRLLGASGFDLGLVPFSFRVLRGRAFFREMEFFRRSPIRRFLAGTAACTGLGEITLKLVQGTRTSLRSDSRYTIEEFQEWDDSIDEIWNAVDRKSCVLGVRHADALTRIFPPANKANRKLLLRRDGRPVAYVVVRSTPMKDDQYFGSMTLGSIVDGWGAEEDVGQLIRMATEFLEEIGADLVISNQINGPWVRALQAAGYFTYRSNFGLAISPKLSSLMGGTLMEIGERCHFNRSDGDGPIHI